MTDEQANVVELQDFEGRKNIGDAIPAAELARLGQLGMSFGIEVFPGESLGSDRRPLG